MPSQLAMMIMNMINDPKDDSSYLSNQEAVNNTIANETKTTASKQKGTGIPDDKDKCCGFVKAMHVKDFMKNYSNVKIFLFGGEAYFEVDEKNIKYVGI